MVDYPTALAHGLRRIITHDRLSKEMDSKALAELWKMAIIFWQGKINTHDGSSFKLRLIPPFFFTYISSFVSEWLLLQIWEEWTDKKPLIRLWMCEDAPGLPYSEASRSRRIGFDTCLSILERQEQIRNLIKVRGNKREVNHLVVWSGSRSLARLEVLGTLESFE